MADQKKGTGGKGGGQEGGQPKGWRAQRDSEGGEKSGFDRALQPDIISEGVTCLVGLVGQSTREGYRVLFLSMDMNSRVEIRDEDIVYSEKLTPEESPFGSLGGTRICVKKGAELDYSRTTARKVQAEALVQDEFDLDIQLGQRASGIRGSGQEGFIPPPLETRPRTFCETCLVTACDTCVNTCEDTCLRTLCDTCPRTVCGPTCATCDTCPRTACGPTCPQTRCNTCNTCRTCPQTVCGIACGVTLPRTICDPCDLTRPITRCDCF